MTDFSREKLPRHLAIIMDGNGRWAKKRGLPRLAGHQKGAESVRTIVTACRRKGIKFLTLFAFSSQNWSRPSGEVRGLMTLLYSYLKSEQSMIMDNGIRLTTIGQVDLLPKMTRSALDELIELSSKNEDMTLCLALSYGGREEIVSMAKDIGKRCASGEIFPDEIGDDLIEKSLWSANLGPVDLMIRTSGELRISNFLLWSLAYSELYFTERMWPEFDEPSLDEALHAYVNRQRRFGTVI